MQRAVFMLLTGFLCIQYACINKTVARAHSVWIVFADDNKLLLRMLLLLLSDLECGRPQCLLHHCS